MRQFVWRVTCLKAKRGFASAGLAGVGIFILILAGWPDWDISRLASAPLTDQLGFVVGLLMIALAAGAGAAARLASRWYWRQDQPSLPASSGDLFGDPSATAACSDIVVQVLLHRTNLEPAGDRRRQLECCATLAAVGWRKMALDPTKAPEVVEGFTKATARGTSGPSRAAWAGFIRSLGQSFHRSVVESAAEALEFGFPMLLGEGYVTGGRRLTAVFSGACRTDLEGTPKPEEVLELEDASPEPADPEEEEDSRAIGATFKRLPRPGPCYGRESDLDELVAMVAGSPCRSVILTGEPGSGTSTVAERAGNSRAARDRFKNRRVAVDLSDVHSVDGAVSRVLQGLGITVAGTPAQTLIRVLQSSPALVILDGCDALLHADRNGAISWLQDLCAASTVIATLWAKGDVPRDKKWPVRTLSPLSNEDAQTLMGAYSEEGRQFVPYLGGNPSGIGLAGRLLREQASASDARKLLRHLRARGKMMGADTGALAVAVGAVVEHLGPQSAAVQLASLVALLPNGCSASDFEEIRSWISGAKPVDGELVRRVFCADHENAGRHAIHESLRKMLSDAATVPAILEARLWSLYAGRAAEGEGLRTTCGHEWAEAMSSEIGNIEAALTLGADHLERRMLIRAAEGYAGWIEHSGWGDISVFERATPGTARGSVQEVEATVAMCTGRTHLVRGTPEVAYRHFLEALDGFSTLGSELDRARVHLCVAEAAIGAGRPSQAESVLLEMVDYFRAEGKGLLRAKALALLGDLSLRASKFSEAARQNREAAEIYHANGAPLGQANCSKNAGEAGLSLYDLSFADADFNSARASYRRLGDPIGEADSLRGLGEIARRRLEPAAARAAFEEALGLYRDHGHLLGEAHTVKSLGNLAMGLEEAEATAKWIEEALVLYQRVGFKVGEANCIRSLGDIALRDGNIARAQEAFTSALALFKGCGAVLGEANCIRSLGDIARDSGQTADAKEAYERALKLYRSVGAHVGEANCLGNLGDFALHAHEYEAAHEAFTVALRLYCEIGSKPGEVTCRQSLADIALTWNQLDVALEQYERALELNRELDRGLETANCLRSLGDVAIRRGDKDEALKLYESALKVFDKFDSFGSIGFVYLRLAEISEAEAEREQLLEEARTVWTKGGLSELVAEHLPSPGRAPKKEERKVA